MGPIPRGWCSNARRKARAGLDALGDGAAKAVVLGVDTDVFVDDEMLGQPADRDEAEARLRRSRAASTRS